MQTSEAKGEYQLLIEKKRVCEERMRETHDENPCDQGAEDQRDGNTEKHSPKLLTPDTFVASVREEDLAKKDDGC